MEKKKSIFGFCSYEIFLFFRLSVRFPCGPLASKSKIENPDEDYGFMDVKGQDSDHYRSDWTWVPVMKSPTSSFTGSPTSSFTGSPKKSTKSASKSTLNRPLPAPPLPPRSASPSTAPSSAIPPYKSSTVLRNSNSRNSRTHSYV